MKFARFGALGHERPGLIDKDGQLRDASGLLAEITVESVAALGNVDPAALPVVTGKPRYGMPVNGTRKFIAIGTNYRDHAIEAGLPIPTEPVVFMKAVNCLAGPDDDVPFPEGATKWIGSRTWHRDRQIRPLCRRGPGAYTCCRLCFG